MTNKLYLGQPENTGNYRTSHTRHQNYESSETQPESGNDTEHQTDTNKNHK